MASFKLRILVYLVERKSGSPRHEGLGSVDGASKALHQGWGQAGRHAEDAEQEEYADGAMIGLEAVEKHLLGDKAELEVVLREFAHGLNDLWQGGSESQSSAPLMLLKVRTGPGCRTIGASKISRRTLFGSRFEPLSVRVRGCR